MDKKTIEIPFGAKDSELYKFEYTIPEGYEARIEDGKVIVRKKESEDEKIRKALIDFFKKKVEKGFEWVEYGIPNNAVLAYLEKQKDKREIDFAEGKVEGVKQTCQEIKDAMSLFEPKDLTPFELTFRDYIDSAIRYCLSGEGYQQYIKEWAADLLNLEKQKEQKPAEWSENDKGLLKRAISIIGWAGSCTDKYKIINPDGAAELQKFLKSLYPSWKPSEEQIGALERAIIKMHIPTDIGILAELRDNLKKL